MSNTSNLTAPQILFELESQNLIPQIILPISHDINTLKIWLTPLKRLTISEMKYFISLIPPQYRLMILIHLFSI